MKVPKLIVTLAVFFAAIINVKGQNTSLNILTQNSGVVTVGGTVFLQVDVSNTDGSTSVPQYKLRPQISVPQSIVTVPASGHQLPAGWTIISNNGQVVRLSNGTDEIPAGVTRTILIAVQGVTNGGPETINGNMFFSNGIAPGSASGVALPGDVTADNTSTSAIQVTGVVPIVITSFTANLVNCQPVLNWATETETNSDRFEIQRYNKLLGAWVAISTTKAAGYSSSSKSYSFTDASLTTDSDNFFYRLKMIDKNGRYSYSLTASVPANCKEKNITVYPNPVQNGDILYIKLQQNKQANAVLISSLGQVVSKMILSKGISKMDVQNIPAGFYTLAVKYDDNLVQNIKIVVCH